VNQVAVNVKSGIGRVSSNPPGITLSHVGKAHAIFEGAVTIIAEPTDKHARAVFSGDCVSRGGYGQKAECKAKLAPDPKINVNFECEKGFTCERGSQIASAVGSHRDDHR
jgi:hypothetical protein